MTDIRTQVLIVGGGAAGSALANELGMRDVKTVVIEQTTGEVTTPKTGHVSARTMEHCRRWGFGDDVNQQGFPVDHPMDTLLCTSLNGYELHREHTPAIKDAGPLPYSPENRTRCPQWLFDPLLARKAAERDSVTYQYEWRLEDFKHAADGPTLAEVTDLVNDEHHRIECDYLIGADGANSTVREKLDVGMSGRGLLNYALIVLFRCERFQEYHDKGAAERYVFIGPEGWRRNITVVDGKGLWRLHHGGQQERFDLDNMDIDSLLLRAFGRDDVEFTIEQVVPWKRTELVVDQMSMDNVFLVGDAAHTLSPTGGFGMNTAIDDSVNLGWKIAGSIKGWGGPELLPSYDAERRPISVRNSRAGTSNFQKWEAPSDHEYLLEESDRGERIRKEVGEAFETVARRVQKSDGIILGYRYEDSPICVSDGTSPTPDDYEVYIPTARPGSRAPHAWMPGGSSTLDLFGDGFVALHTSERSREAGRLAEAAKHVGIPLKTHQFADPEVQKAYDRDLVLVRPDGHVAYAGSPSLIEETDAATVLRKVTGHN